MIHHTYHHKRERYLFVDILRFLAVILMLQGHTFEALLQKNIKEESWFFIHDLFHGLTAPMFLFSSGVAFGIATFKKWEDHTELGFPIYKRMFRFVGLIFLGYVLHLPYYGFKKLVYASTEIDILTFFQVDALQCIAVTLLTLQLLVLLIKNEKKFTFTLIAIATTIIFISPIIYNLKLKDNFPIWFGSYINYEFLSWFPLFPWSAYTMLGVIFSYFFIEEKEHEHAIRFMKKLFILVSIIGLSSYIFSNIQFYIYPSHDFWKTNPLVVFGKTSVITMLMVLLFFIEQKIHIKSKIPTIIGSESLFIYVIHLIIIYGSVLNVGLKYFFDGKLNITYSLIVFLILLITLTWFAIVWHNGKIKYKKEFLYIRIISLILFLFFFLIQ